MMFGLRLPGPFRVGVSSSGRVNAGVTLGPFSVSGNVGGTPTARGMFFPVTLHQFVAQAQAEGFSVQVTPGTSATIERRWKAGRAEVVRGGVIVRRVLSTWQILALLGTILAVVALCCGPTLYEMRADSPTS